jgi:hypothetical protein
MTINFNDVTDTATPTSGTFNTGGNANVRGSGQNAFTQSQDYTQAVWSKTGSTITAASIIAPNGTLTGQTLNEDTSSTQHNILRSGPEVLSIGATYTMSVFAKQAGRSVIFMQSLITFAKSYFDIANGTVLSSGAGMTSTITSVGDGWFRCAVTFVCDSTNNSIRVIAATTGNGVQTYTGTGIASVYLWGAQMELGATANTYIPTTTAAIYGTPTLSLSEVAGLGLQSDGSLYVRPAGTGALQAQPTTSTTVGGNARGPNAVDWQMSRTNANQVTSGTQSVIGGGSNNTSSGYATTTAGGELNTNIAYNGFIGAGSGNTLGSNAQRSVIVGGVSNTANGFLNFIGGGALNSGTSGVAVTTQSATMNGTTAVTLSGSNANIRVGQLITGTSIQVFPYTYVAAISGTSLTLSQNATGSTTNNISFFAPHGIVVGGGNNQATGAYSFIGGGGDAGTAANRNVASGDWSTVGGGFVNRATGKWSTAVGGGGNLASGEAAVVVGGGSYNGGLVGNTASAVSTFIGAGFGNTAAGYCSVTVGGAGNNTSNNFSFIGGGSNSVANGGNSAIIGGTYGTTRGISGNHIFPACDIPIASFVGVSQAGLLVLARQTTDATATVLTSNASAATTNNQVILPNNAAYYFKGSCIANVTGAANGAAWSFEGAIMRGANAASTVLIDTPSVNRVAASAGATAWTIALTADTTNGGLTVTVTGVASTTIRWVAKVETTEVTF